MKSSTGAGGEGVERTAPSDAVARLVRSCRRQAVLAHHGRALCGGAGAAFATLALFVYGGGDFTDLEALGLAAFVGIVAYAAWICSERFSDHDVARSLEQAFPNTGLLASFEAAEATRRTELTELAALRVYRSVPRERARAVAAPAPVPFIALPLVAVSAFMVAVDHRLEESGAERARGSLEDLVEGLADAEVRLGAELVGEDRESLQSVLAEVEEARTRGRAVAAEDARRWSDSLEDLARERGEDDASALREMALAAELLAPLGSEVEGAENARGSGDPEATDGALPESGTEESGTEESGTEESGTEESGIGESGIGEIAQGAERAGAEPAANTAPRPGAGSGAGARSSGDGRFSGDDGAGELAPGPVGGSRGPGAAASDRTDGSPRPMAGASVDEGGSGAGAPPPRRIPRRHADVISRWFELRSADPIRD